ncbi:MAG: D-alanyl-D-alanine carboxypeptidase [Candidatus Rickettsia vulgarisii]
MKNLKITTLLLLISSIYLNISCAYSYDNKKLIDHHEIQRIDPNLNIGVKIRNLKTNKVIYECNVDRHYNFASSVKFIVIAGLQKYFGNDYKFVSKILHKNSDYYLDIGAPNFSTEDLDYMVKELKEKSSNNIKGNFYIVNTSFSLPSVIDSRMIDDSKYCYGAPITKVHINKNCFRLKVSPSKTVNNKISVYDENQSVYKIVNNTSTVSSGSEEKLIAIIKDDELLISGTLNQDHKDLTIVPVANDNLNYIKLSLEKLLSKLTLN